MRTKASLCAQTSPYREWVYFISIELVIGANLFVTVLFYLRS